MRFSSIRAKIISDSRGKETIEVFASLEVGAIVSASVPQGESKGTHEAVYLLPERACETVQGEIASALCDRNWKSAEDIDRALIALDGTKNKSRLGANAILSVSICASRAEALENGIPLWKQIQKRIGKDSVSFPLLFINMIEGGLHVGSGLSIQEFLAIPKTSSPKEAREAGEDFYHALGKELAARYGNDSLILGDEGGYAPKLLNEEEPFQIFDEIRKSLGAENDFEYGYDAAATNISLSKEKLFSIHEALAKKFPVSFIEDPFGEEEFEWFAKLKQVLGERVLIAGDDLTVTNPERMNKARTADSINSVIIKPNQIGTISESLEAARLAESYGWKTVVSHRGGETNDDWIADVAVGIGAYGMKLGAPSRKERIVKYDRLSTIERECGGGKYLKN